MTNRAPLFNDAESHILVTWTGIAFPAMDGELGELRERLKRYQVLLESVSDRRAILAIKELAKELQARIDAMSGKASS